MRNPIACVACRAAKRQVCEPSVYKRPHKATNCDSAFTMIVHHARGVKIGKRSVSFRFLALRRCTEFQKFGNQ